MELKRLLIACFTLGLFACSYGGTEVLSPPNPNESPKPRTIDSPLYQITMLLPDGWTYKEYGPDVPPGPETFEDIDPETVTVAQFMKKDSGFTIFFSTLTPDETLETFVRERRPIGDIQLQQSPDDENTFIALFNQEEAGPHGGFVVDFYGSVDEFVLWMRAEAVGIPEEQEKTLNEFFGVIVPSIDFQPKF